MPVTHNMSEITRELSRAVLNYAEVAMRDIDRAYFESAVNVHNNWVINSPVDKGIFRASIQGPIKVAVAHYESRSNLAYGPTIEYGGWLGVGPKTVRLGAQTLPSGVEINPGVYSINGAFPLRLALSQESLVLKEKTIEALSRR